MQDTLTFRHGGKSFNYSNQLERNCMDPFGLIHPILLASNPIGDFELILKVVGLLFIISFVRSHIQHPLLSTILILGISAFLLFDVWKVFGGILLLYLLFFFGFVHILVDLSFMQAFTSPLFNIGGWLRGKPKHIPQHPQGGYNEGQRPHEYEEEREHEYEEEHRHEEGEYEPNERGFSPEPRHTQERNDSREQEQRTRYEHAMHQRMNQLRRGKRDER